MNIVSMSSVHLVNLLLHLHFSSSVKIAVLMQVSDDQWTAKKKTETETLNSNYLVVVLFSLIHLYYHLAEQGGGGGV